MNKGQVEQIAAPEKMLENPASDLVRSFLGKHQVSDSTPLYVEDFMRTNPYTVSREKGVLECAEKMARSGVDTLLVTDDDDRYLGTVSIRDIKLRGKSGQSIEPLISDQARTVCLGDDAQESVNYLLTSGESYVVVLKPDQTVAGIITKNSMSEAGPSPRRLSFSSPKAHSTRIPESGDPQRAPAPPARKTCWCGPCGPAASA